MADCVAAIVLLSSCCEPLVAGEFQFLVCIRADKHNHGRVLPNRLPEQNKSLRTDSTRSATVVSEQAQELNRQLVDLHHT